MPEIVIAVSRPGHLPRYHAAVNDDGNLLTPEACNLDQAHTKEQLPILPSGIPLRRVCKRCFRQLHEMMAGQPGAVTP